jgi:hypothetical protein
VLRRREVRLAKTAVKFVWPKVHLGPPPTGRIARQMRGRPSDCPNYQNNLEHIMNTRNLQLIATGFSLAARVIVSS